jgi:hypothetical protein
MYLKGFVRYHKLNVTIFLFLVLFTLIHLLKPVLIYEKNGSFREFGVGYRHKTVIPIWGVAIVLAIFSYLAVLTYIRTDM